MSKVNNSDMCWYALYTKSRHEKKVEKMLLEKGVNAFLPMVETVRKWKDRKKRVQVPLFNSYVFVQIDLRDRYIALRTDGVVRLVTFSGEPAVVPDWQIAQLKQLIEKPETLQLESYLTAGDLVEVLDGPFAGVKGRLLEVRGETRLVVNIDGIMQSASVIVEPDSVRKIDALIS